MVTAQSLLHGAAYSLEQCGRLLGDAGFLNENRSYATALAVAAFASEELGRWRILLDLRKDVLAGKSLTVKDVETACKDHVEKQEANMAGLTLRGNNRVGVGKLAQSRMKAPPGSKERNEADKQFDRAYQKILKRTPDERHRLRMAALYVDILSEEQWRRPTQEVSQITAYEFLVSVISDYERQRQQRYTELALVKSVDPELHDALVQWVDRPELPQVAAPSFPATG